MTFRRICIIGPSSGGKSTLADRLGKLLDYPVLHMDKTKYRLETVSDSRNNPKA